MTGLIYHGSPENVVEVMSPSPWTRVEEGCHMKAAVTDGEGYVWVDENVPMPKGNEYQCLCKMLACASCTGTDQKHIHNKLPWTQNYPGLLGHESIGRVIEVGTKVTAYKEGDLVFRPTPVYPGQTLGGYSSMWGGFSEYGLVTDVAAMRADDPSVTPNNYTRFQQLIPASVNASPVDLTMMITLKECASYVASCGVKLYDSVAVLGAGSVGISMIRFAKIFGAYPVIAVARRDEQLAYARDVIGADFVVNAAQQDAVAAIRDLTGGKGVDRIIDTSGSIDLTVACIPALAENGKAAAYATYERGDSVAKHADPEKLVTGKTGEDIAHQYLIDCVRLGLVTLGDFYSHVMPLSQIAEGFAMLEKKEAFKVVFTF